MSTTFHIGPRVGNEDGSTDICIMRDGELFATTRYGTDGGDLDGEQEREAEAAAKMIVERLNATPDPVNAKLVEACKGLLDIIHDDLTHARQADHAEALNKAREALALAGGGA